MENEAKEPAPKYNYISTEQYLEMERASEVKHEYYKGEVFALLRPANPHFDIIKSREHNIIVKNISAIVLPFLKDKPCDMFGSDLQIYISENSLCTNPDLFIVCGEWETLDEEKDTIKNPSVIVEVSSKATSDYDRGTKFHLYRSIKTLKEYIVVDSLSVSVELFVRQEGNRWNLTEYKQLSESFHISTINLTLHLGQIYEDVSFEE